MNVITYKVIDTITSSFHEEFSILENSFFNILGGAYGNYYGREYHMERIINGRAIIYLAFAEEYLIGASYVKRNLRRGGTAVYPEKYRRLGVAENLVRLSLIDFPKQYSILSTNLEHSYKMIQLMKKSGFKNGKSTEEIEAIVGEEFKLLTNFRNLNGYLIFDRESERRKIKREMLTLMHTF